MKNKITLLLSASAFALMACSSLEVSNPEEENFPADWSSAAYMAVNPDLRALQIMDQVTILNTKNGLASDAADETAFESVMEAVALNYAGFDATTWDATDASKTKYVKSFNVYGYTDELNLFATMVLDTAALDQQYIAYGKTEGRPYRTCAAGEGSVVKGECQAYYIEGSTNPHYDNHKYCSNAGVTYCIDCAATDVCPVAATSTEATAAE